MKKLLFIVGLSVSIMSCEKPLLQGVELEQEHEFQFDYDLQDVYSILDMFINDAKRNGLDLDYIYTSDISFEFVSGYEFAGTSHGTNKEGINITFNAEYFESMAPLKRVELVYHELGHDVLNFRHRQGFSIDGLELMNQNQNRDIKDIFELFEASKKMFEYKIVN